VLDELFATASDDADIRSKNVSIESLEALVENMEPAVSALKALEPASKIKIIAEIKRSSPSVGHMAEIPDAGLLALTYEQSGAHAISVLTERSGFGGSLDDLRHASDAVSIPTLRKDFISCEYQILEARAHGASFVLLILSWLNEPDFLRLSKFAADLGLDVLVETHTAEEIHIANAAGSRLVGINTRDLQTFKTDLRLFETMSHLLSDETIKVAESSVKKPQDVARYWNAGANVVLIGQALVTGDPSFLIPEFINET
jgi:indole-3-glycerol phosphate synthase|tara:strand:+ start:2827 stop:3600 length:774 start_codon:yes stop_codon:yes gene_type:complete